MLVSDFESAGWSIVGLKPSLHSHWQNTHTCFHEPKHKEQNDQPALACSSFTPLNNSFLPEVYWLRSTADEEEVVKLGTSFPQEEIRSWLLGSNCSISLFSLVSWQQELSFTTTVALSLSSWQQDLSFATAIIVYPSAQDLSFATAIIVSPSATGWMIPCLLDVGISTQKVWHPSDPPTSPKLRKQISWCLWVLMIIITHIKADVNTPSGSFRIRQCNIKQ
jgi:hypothetical protein